MAQRRVFCRGGGLYMCHHVCAYNAIIARGDSRRSRRLFVVLRVRHRCLHGWTCLRPIICV